MEDPDYLSFLGKLRVHGDSYAVEIQREGFAAPVLLKYEVGESIDVVNPRRKRIRGEEAQIGAGIGERRTGRAKRPQIESGLNGSGELGFDCGDLRSNVKIEKEEEIDLNEKKDAFFERESGKGKTDSTNDSVIAKVVKQEQLDSEVSERSSNNSVFAKSEKKKEGPSGSRGTASSAIRKAERDEVKKGERPQAQRLKQVAKFDWIEEIKGPNFTKCSEFTNCPNSDEEEKYEIPKDILDKTKSEFKDKLIKYLSTPFNKKEYKALMKAAARRSKKTLSKETRRGVRDCETGEHSKSYFDWYPGFAKEVEKAGKGRRWFLLRGFFFWLQNNCCEGQFMPWVVDKGTKDHKDGSAS